MTDSYRDDAAGAPRPERVGPVTPLERAEALLEVRARRYTSTGWEFAAARDQLTEAVREAVAAGMSEVQAAKVAGVTRMTVRSWLGKGRS